jgi:HD-like signal output (HDOD) protein
MTTASTPSPVSDDRLEQLARQVDRLHSGPGIAQRILVLTRDPDFDMQEVASCLEHDPALTARILRLINSPRYGLANKVASVRHAASYLGRRSLQLVTLSFTLLDRFAAGPHRDLYRGYWQRALTMACVGRRLAEQSKEVAPDEAYSTGLLADVGVLSLAQVVGDYYVALCLTRPHGPEFQEAEINLLGFDHSAFGVRLLEGWGLPERLLSAIRRHHVSNEGGEPLDEVVHAGWLMAEALWTPNSPHVQAARRFLEERCDVDLDGFVELALECRNDVEDAAKIFGISVGTFDCQKLADEARRQSLESALEATLELDALEAVVEGHAPPPGSTPESDASSNPFE